MVLNTASEVISFARRLEENSAKFYENLARQYQQAVETFLSFAAENRKNIVQVERAYYGVITDALEGGFAFNLKPNDYELRTELPEKANYAGAVARAIEIEEKLKKIYLDAAAQSKLLMADVPRAFALVARKRDSRISKLNSL